MDNIEEVVQGHDRAIAAITEQIKTLFNRQECLDELTKAVAAMAVKMETVEKGQTKIEKGIDELKAVPAKKWDIVTVAVITGIVSSIISVIAALLLK